MGYFSNLSVEIVERFLDGQSNEEIANEMDLELEDVICITESV